MPDKDALANRRRGNDEICKEYGIEVSPALVLPKLFDSSTHFNKCAFEEAQVFATTNHGVPHIFNSIATPIILCGEGA